MHDAEKAAGEAAGTAKPKFDDWAATLDQTTGAFTRATRAMVLQKLQTDGMISAAGQLGINTRDLIGATLGQEGAMRRVANATKGNTDILKGLTNQKLSEWLYKNRDALRSQQTQMRQNIHDTQTWSQALRGVPKKVQARLANLDYKPTMAQVRALKRQYDLTPKQVRTIIKETGVTQTRGKVKDLQGIIKEFGNTKPSNKWLQFYVGDLTGARQKTSKGTADINRGLSEGTAKARPNLNPFTQMFQSNLTGLKGTASSGGKGIGSNLGSGINSGIGGWFSTISATAAAAVRQAAQAARNEAKIASPSKVFRTIGNQLGDGLAKGIRDTLLRASKEGKALAAAVFSGVMAGSSGAERAIAQVTKLIEKRIKGKDQEKREKALLKRYADEFQAIKKNAKAQDAVNRRLDAARDKLREIVDERKEYARAIKDSFVAFGDVTALGRNEDGSVSITSLIDQLKDKVRDAKRFADLIKTLQKQGLNRTSIEQMLAAGPEAALATAEAITAGGASAITEMNSLTSQLAASGDLLGDTMGDRYFNAGIKAAEGIVKGLESEAKKLDRAAIRMADALVKAVKKALGIKSPSTVFRGLGDNVTKGLVIGLDETYVKRSAASLASSLEQGFGTPALEAYASQRASQASQTGVRVTLTSEQVSQLQRGREVAMDLDAYYAAGGRRRS
jgi:hypothetical protein